jgi:hypothetical protein
MKEIIEAIIAASMNSDIIDKAKKEFHRRFINGELNKELLKDIESINVKSLNQLLEDILDGEYSIEDKVKAVEQWDNIILSYIKYISDMRDSAKESYDKLLAKYEASKAPIYSVFYCPENHLVFLDKNDKLRKSFNGNAKTLYSGNSKDEARRICESFLKDCPDFYCVDYTKIYNK